MVRLLRLSTVFVAWLFAQAICVAQQPTETAKEEALPKGIVRADAIVVIGGKPFLTSDMPTMIVASEKETGSRSQNDSCLKSAPRVRHPATQTPGRSKRVPPTASSRQHR